LNDAQLTKVTSQRRLSRRRKTEPKHWTRMLSENVWNTVGTLNIVYIMVYADTNERVIDKKTDRPVSGVSKLTDRQAERPVSVRVGEQISHSWLPSCIRSC